MCHPSLFMSAVRTTVAHNEKEMLLGRAEKDRNSLRRGGRGHRRYTFGTNTTPACVQKESTAGGAGTHTKNMSNPTHAINRTKHTGFCNPLQVPGMSEIFLYLGGIFSSHCVLLRTVCPVGITGMKKHVRHRITNSNHY